MTPFSVRARICRAIHQPIHLYPRFVRSSIVAPIIHTSDSLRCFSFSSATKNYNADCNNDKGNVLFLSPSLYPHPAASAAGVRTTSLLTHFASEKLFSSVHYGSGARIPSGNDDNGTMHELRSLGVTFHSVRPNRTHQMQALLDQIPELKAVVFDRFHSEESFSFQIRRWRPDIVRIVDMQDFHCLRLGRQDIVESWDREKKEAEEDGKRGNGMGMMEEVMNYIPGGHGELRSNGVENEEAGRRRRKREDLFLRELSSLHRSDLILVCSSYELDLLSLRYNLPSHKLCLAPFFTRPLNQYYDDAKHGYERRKDFVTIGGFKHPPNLDSILYLKRHLWKQIRSALPDCKVYVYGSYPPPRIQQLHHPKSGFIVRGYVDTLDEALGNKRVLLAPLRYGAGLKGKIVDGWRFGLPAVTTPIGSEGMVPTMETDDGLGDVTARMNNESHVDGWGGLIASDDESFVRSAVRLYSNQSLWKDSRDNGRRLISKLYDEKLNLDIVTAAVVDATRYREERRAEDITGAMLWHQYARSTEYFSRWVELKETSFDAKRED